MCRERAYPEFIADADGMQARAERVRLRTEQARQARHLKNLANRLADSCRRDLAGLGFRGCHDRHSNGGSTCMEAAAPYK